jgi:hypothetical protein
MVLWLCGAPSADDMRALLKTDVFRQRVKEFIEANIKADVSSTNTRQLVASRRERGLYDQCRCTSVRKRRVW